MTSLLLSVLVVGVWADGDHEDPKNDDRSCNTSTYDKLCDSYIWMTLIALFATFIQFLLLGFAVYYIIINFIPKLEVKREINSIGIKKRLSQKLRSTLSQNSSYSKDSLTSKDPEPHHVKPPNKAASSNHSNVENHYTLHSKQNLKKSNSPMPPPMSLPPIPHSNNRHSQKSFGNADDHEYAYIELPIKPPQQNQLNTPEAETTSSGDGDDQSEHMYDTLMHLGKGKE